MKRNTVTSFSLLACFAVVCFLLTPALSSESISLPVVMNDQGFVITITDYYVSSANTIVMVGTVMSPQAMVLKSLTGLAFVNGMVVGRGTLDESPLQLMPGVPTPVSATVTTNFNIYYALWLGQIAVGDGRIVPFRCESTPITVVLTGQLCALPAGDHCFPWPDFNQTSTLALL
jgi:hypothetical protein